MKKISFLIVGIVMLGLVKISSGQVTLNCESGNRAIEQGNCWGFGANSYSNSVAYVISGIWSTKSNSLTNTSPTASWI